MCDITAAGTSGQDVSITKTGFVKAQQDKLDYFLPIIL